VLAELNIVPRIIAAGDPATLNFDCDFRQWTPESELTELTQLGIGLAPLPDDAWERGKCGVKLLQYMACGIPVIASPVGANAEIVQDGVNGFLAHDAAEWTTKLRQLLADAGLRAKLGQAGRETVMQRYDLCDAAAAVAVVLHKAAAANTHTNGITGKQNRISATPNA
jgi:glycosyltransferase involved in cell wall biosynthesis